VPLTKERLDDTVLCFHQSLENKEGHQEDKQQVGVSEERVVAIDGIRRRSERVENNLGFIF